MTAAPRVAGPRVLALAIVLGWSVPRTGRSQAADTSALGPQLSLETVVARTLVYSPGVAGAQGAVRDAAAARRVALGSYLPTVSLISSAGWSDQTLAGAVVTPGLSSTSAMNTYGAGLAGALDVFTGGRRGAQRRYADAISQAADAGFVQQHYATTLLAKQAYFDVLRAHELVRVAGEFVAHAEVGFGYARDRLAAGTATRADVLLAELALSTARRQQLAARDTLSLTSAALGRLVGANGSVDAGPATTLEPTPLALGDSGVLALAPAAAPAVAYAQALASADNASVRVSKSQYVPTISVGAGYNWANRSGVPGALRAGWVVAFTTSFPLFNGFQREASVTQAEVAAEVATTTAADTKRLARADAQQLLGRLHVAEQDITLTREAVRLATEDLRVLQARYRAGIATILDVLTAQTALIQAELDLVSARFTYQVARASLEALLGRDL
jgi:outer membrane protein TolC